jgi:hypothetical protein
MQVMCPVQRQKSVITLQMTTRNGMVYEVCIPCSVFSPARFFFAVAVDSGCSHTSSGFICDVVPHALFPHAQGALWLPRIFCLRFHPLHAVFCRILTTPPQLVILAPFLLTASVLFLVRNFKEDLPM